MPSVARVLFALLISALALALAIHAKPAAAVLPTESVVPASEDREKLRALVSRPEVARKLEALGVLPKDAAERVDALTEDEVRALAARIDALPAGGLSNQEWLLVIIVILLLVIAL